MSDYRVKLFQGVDVTKLNQKIDKWIEKEKPSIGHEGYQMRTARTGKTTVTTVAVTYYLTPKK